MSWSTVEVSKLRRGDQVRAIRHLDIGVADAKPGDLGVVFEQTNAYGDGCGPMVRWHKGTACNVYDGDVERVSKS